MWGTVARLMETRSRGPVRVSTLDTLLAVLSSAPGGQWAAVQVDICKFGVLNAVLGSATGDRVLELIEERLTQEQDFTWSRVGADAWLGVVRMSCSSSLHARLVRIRQEVISHTAAGLSRNLRLNLAVGFASGTLATGLLGNASIACAAAKLAPGEVIDFDSEPHVEGAPLIKALMEGASLDQHMELHHQRIVHRDGGVHFEILSRMPGYPTEAVVRAIESMGLASAFDVEVVRRAAAMLSAAVPLHAVNLSAHTVCQADAITEIIGILRRRPNLAVEITESAIMRDEQAARESIMRLRAAGIEVFLDDYGDGSTTLTMLDMPFTSLKLGQRLVSDACSPDVVQAVISLAANRRMPVIAEMVETREQYDRHLAAGVAGFQGWYFHKPEKLKGVFLEAHDDSAELPDICPGWPAASA
ncbi:EAL domain-containing protein [Geopseudomonas aromaticivorans]